jgi:hypothetical protein
MYNKRASIKAQDVEKARDMALFTLKQISLGGIHGKKEST